MVAAASTQSVEMKGALGDVCYNHFANCSGNWFAVFRSQTLLGICWGDGIHHRDSVGHDPLAGAARLGSAIVGPGSRSGRSTLLAIFLRAVGIGLAGFLGGVYLSMSLAAFLNITDPTIEIVISIVGGILGLAFILAVFDWALIVLSAVTGAVLLAGYLPLEAGYALLVMAVLMGVGIFMQAQNKIEGN